MPPTALKNRARVGDEPKAYKAANTITRNGVTYTRAMGLTSDPMHVPPELVPEGMVYQWNRTAIYNEPDQKNMVTMERAGWRPVPADRHEGFFMPKGHQGAIIHDGLMLMERPIELEMAAREEEREKWMTQNRETRQSFGMSPQGSGFETATPAARNATFARTRFESGRDIPAPNLNEISVDD